MEISINPSLLSGNIICEYLISLNFQWGSGRPPHTHTHTLSRSAHLWQYISMYATSSMQETLIGNMSYFSKRITFRSCSLLFKVKIDIQVHVGPIYMDQYMWIYFHDINYLLLLLIQTAPSHILGQLDKVLREASTLDGVLEFRHEHFWTLSFGTLVRIRYIT